MENLRVAGGEQQENAPLDQRNDLLRRFAARRPDLVRRHRAQAVGQTVAHLLQIGIAAEIGFGFLRLCGQDVQYIVAEPRAQIGRAAFPRPRHIKPVVQLRHLFLHQAGHDFHAPSVPRLHMGQIIPITLGQKLIQQRFLQAQGQRLHVQHKFRVAVGAEQIFHQQRILADVLMRGGSLRQIQLQAQPVSPHGFPGLLRQQVIAIGHVLHQGHQLLRQRRRAHFRNAPEAPLIQQRLHLLPLILAAHGEQFRLNAAVGRALLLVLIALDLQVDVVVFAVVGANGGAGLLLRRFHLYAPGMIAQLQHHLRQQHLHLGRAGGNVHQDLRLRILAAQPVHHVVERLIQLVHIGNIADGKILLQHHRSVAVPMGLEVGKHLFIAFVRLRQLSHLGRKQQADHLGAVVAQDVQHSAVALTANGIGGP